MSMCAVRTECSFQLLGSLGSLYAQYCSKDLDNFLEL